MGFIEKPMPGDTAPGRDVNPCASIVGNDTNPRSGLEGREVLAQFQNQFAAGFFAAVEFVIEVPCRALYCHRPAGHTQLVRL